MSASLEEMPQADAFAELSLGWDGADPWGSAMALGFGLCIVARTVRETRVHDILSYSPGMEPLRTLEELTEDEYEYEASVIASAYLAGTITDDDLVDAANALSVFLDECKAAGLDY